MLQLAGSQGPRLRSPSEGFCARLAVQGGAVAPGTRIQIAAPGGGLPPPPAISSQASPPSKGTLRSSGPFSSTSPTGSDLSLPTPAISHQPCSSD